VEKDAATLSRYLLAAVEEVEETRFAIKGRYSLLAG